jgi:HK97 gp10 family phage protein
MGVKLTKIKFGDISTALKAITKNSNLELGTQIASQAKALAPVQYGQLRNSISATSLSKSVLLNNSSGEKAEKLETSGLSGDEVYVGSNSDHTIYQEYGTVKQPAQPFLRPATELKAKGANVADIVSKYNRKAMEAELKKRKETVVTNG